MYHEVEIIHNNTPSLVGKATGLLAVRFSSALPVFIIEVRSDIAMPVLHPTPTLWRPKLSRGPLSHLDYLPTTFHLLRCFSSHVRGSNDRDRINALKGATHLRLVIDLNHLRSDGRGDLAARILRRPAPYMYALREAARDVALAMDPAFNKTLKDRDIMIGFEGR